MAVIHLEVVTEGIRTKGRADGISVDDRVPIKSVGVRGGDISGNVC